MGIPILLELNEELTRLFVAGSRLSAQDPRIKKFIDPLKNLAAKAPVFGKLAGHVEELVTVESALSATKLIETKAFLLALCSTQGQSDTDEKTTDMEHADTELAFDFIPYRRLSPVINAMRNKGSGYSQVLQKAMDEQIFKDPRTHDAAVQALNDKNLDWFTDNALPAIGMPVYARVLADFNMEGKGHDAHRLHILHTIGKEKALPLIEECIEKASPTVKAEAVKILGDYPAYENLLIACLKDKKAVRQEAMNALAKMDSVAGIKLMADKISSDEDVQAALASAEGEFASKVVCDYMAQTYEQMQQNRTIPFAVSFYRSMEMLKNKKSPLVMDFLKRLLSESFLKNLDKELRLQGSFHYSLYNTALIILFDSGQGNDFVFDLFLRSDEKEKKEMPLAQYAFTIGASRMDAEDFYDLFFKTGVYKSITKDSKYFFRYTFQTNDGSLKRPISRRMAGYLAREMKDFILASQLIFEDDHETMELLVARLKKTIDAQTIATHLSEELSILSCMGKRKHKDFKKMHDQLIEKCHFYNNPNINPLYYGDKLNEIQKYLEEVSN